MCNSQATDRLSHELAAKLAVQCRRIVQACLREEEWIDADREFYLIIRDGINALMTESSGRESDTRTITRPSSGKEESNDG
jgi:hypothetical protein